MAEEEIYRAIFEQSDDAIFITKGEHILEVNPEGCKLLGYDKAHFEKISPLSIFTEESLPGIQKALSAALENKSVFFESKIKRSDNSILDVEVSFLAMGDRRNTLTLIVRDITLRKESERLMQVEREILSALLKKSLCGILLIEASSHKIVDVNPIATKTIGRSKEEIVGNICHQFICPAEVGKCPISDLGLTVDNSEKKMINAQKEVIPILKSVVPVIIEDKEYFVECFIDLSESKRTEKRLLQAKVEAEAASRAKSEFLANISHELRTPLNSIIGFSEILLEEFFGDLNEKQQKYVNNISVSGKHLLGLINDILDLSKVEAGKMELNYSEFSIGSVFEEVKSTILPLAQVKSLGIDFTLDLDNGNIQADRSRLIQILYNLVSNAVKFTPEGGKVSVYCKKSGNIATFSITDTGIGISSENQKYLFEPFKQIDSGMNRQYGGTGLGLFLVKQFVDLHKGRIWLTSFQGKGSSFIFELPVNCLDDIEKTDNAFKDSETKVGASANFSG